MSSIRDVKGPHRAAAFLLGLDPAKRSAILAKMSEDVAATVAAAMLSLDPRLTGDGVVDELKSDIARSLHGPTPVRPCDAAQLRELLTGSLGPQAGERVVSEILARRRAANPFVEVEELDPFEVGRALREESNAVVALVLAYLDPAVSAKVLTLFDEERGIDVVKRMAFLEPPNAAVLATVAESLQRRVRELPAVVGTSDPSARLKSVSDVLKESSPALEKGVIESMAGDDAQKAQELREFMFTWEDIATIDTRTMQKILGTVDTKTLSVALKGCSPEIEKNIFDNLSTRVRDMVSEERELAGPMPMSEIQGSRDDIMKNIRALIEAGEFRPSRGGDDLVA